MGVRRLVGGGVVVVGGGGGRACEGACTNGEEAVELDTRFLSA